MGLVNRIRKAFLYTIFFVFNIIAIKSFAGWSVSQEIIQGTWGASENQFGITTQDTYDFIPFLDITTDQKIVIRDGTNSRVKVYSSSGALELIVPYKVNLDYRDLTIADSYGFSGDFVGYGEGGVNYYYRTDQKVYIHFSPTGALIKTSTERPLELGRVVRNSVGSGKYRYSVEYPGNTYSIEAGGFFDEIIKDTNNYLNGIQKIDSGEEFWTYQVSKYSACGKEIGVLKLPPKHLAPKVVERQQYGIVEHRRQVLDEYGSPVIAPNGDVYTWKRTPDKYSILKWIWVDDPNVPAGPDAPTGLTVMPSTSGIYLTWTPSPQDPGCVTNYEVARATTAGGMYSTVTTVDKGAPNTTTLQ